MDATSHPQQRPVQALAVVDAPELPAEWLGRLRYADALRLQQARHAARCAGSRGDALLLLEHTPVVTLGRGSELAHETVALAPLAARGIEVLRSGRGGRATYHGPGQLVGYPIVDLRNYGRDIHAYAGALEAALIAAAADFGVRARRRDGLRGVWVEHRKLASIGVEVKRWVTMHGFALNVDMDLAPFELFTPCGLQSVRFTSLAAEAGVPIRFAEVRDSVAQRLREALQPLAGRHDD